MFRVLRYCWTFLTAGLIGMLTGMVGQVYIYEFSDRNDVLMQAVSVFKDLNEVAFLVAFVAALVFQYFCSVLEYRRWSRHKKRNEAIKKT